MRDFEKWANQFDHDSDEWEDMDREAVFNAGMGEARAITPAMIEAGAQRLVRWDENSVWPDSWSAPDVAAARQDAERGILSALSVMGNGDEHWAGTPEQEIETLREMVEQRDAEIEQLRGRLREAIGCLETIGGKSELGESILMAEKTELASHAADGFRVIGDYAKEGAQRLRTQVEAAEKGEVK